MCLWGSSYECDYNLRIRVGFQSTFSKISRIPVLKLELYPNSSVEQLNQGCCPEPKMSFIQSKKHIIKNVIEVDVISEHGKKFPQYIRLNIYIYKYILQKFEELKYS